MVAAVAMFAAVSCNKELSQNDHFSGDVVTFTASVDGVNTKVKLDGTVSKWESGDEITIHNGTNGFTFSTDGVGATADFTYAGANFSGDKFIAVYPAGDYTVDTEAKTVRAYIPTDQEAVAGTYALKGSTKTDAALAVAYTEDNNLSFKNASALLKFTINCDDVKAIEFYGNNSEAITGNMLVSLNEDATVKTVEGLDTEIEGKSQKGTWVKCYSPDEANRWCFKKGTYYAAIAPHSFTKGVAMNLILEDDKKVEPFKKLSTSKEVKPNTILDLGTIEHKTIYLRPGIWTEANAWVFAHFFDGAYAKDVKMTDSDGDGILEAAIPFGVKKVIFVRKNPANSNLDWDGEWNRSAELTLPTNTAVCYSINDWNSMKWETLEEARKQMLYLKPNSNWTQGSARFAAYFFKDNAGNAWRAMTDWNKDGIYEVSKPTSNNTKMIFCRMNPSFTNNSWDADGNDYQWNKTGDLTVPTDGKNLFTIASGMWDGSTTTWSKKTF